MKYWEKEKGRLQWVRTISVTQYFFLVKRNPRNICLFERDKRSESARTYFLLLQSSQQNAKPLSTGCALIIKSANDTQSCSWIWSLNRNRATGGEVRSLTFRSMNNNLTLALPGTRFTFAYAHKVHFQTWYNWREFSSFHISIFCKKILVKNTQEWHCRSTFVS